MKKIPKILIFVSFIASFATSSVLAETATSSGDVGEITENLKNRLKATVESVTETDQNDIPKAYVGVVKDIVKDTIVIEDKDGKINIKINDDSDILRSPGNTVIKLESVRIDDGIIALGYGSREESVDGKRIIVSADPFTPPEKTSAISVIKEFAKNTIILVDGEKEIELATTSKTVFKNSDGVIDKADLNEGDTILFSALVDEDGDYTATVVLQTKKAETPSPSPSPLE